MSLHREDGGIALPDIDALIEAKKINWIARIYYCEEQTWNFLGKYYLASYDLEYGIQGFLLHCSSLDGLKLSNIPSFYKSCQNI